MLGVCYYPEHWDPQHWAVDAARMVALGLTYVRIGEFAWSRLEPEAGRYDFAWLDAAIATLADAGLKVVLGTPTATPPKWLVDALPDMLPVDPGTGRTRGFGSRRHYDFSSRPYGAACGRIVTTLAERYGGHPAVAGWQIDNELCCHDTALSASPAARDAFRAWLAARYGNIDALNAAWGNVFWSMDYAGFDSIDLPVGAVTETGPSHRLAWRRFASDEVARFMAEQLTILRERSPGRFVTHNFIPPHETGVDNHAVARGLDFASYDNYPLGRADLWFADAPPEAFAPMMRTGHPDLQGFFFDQTRSLAPGRFWVMEQQPGPVNWARHNPAPAPGMVRLWSLEAFAHGAAVVSYFRWRQVPFAQEQMHAGLRAPDDTPASAWTEVEAVVRDLGALELDAAPDARAPVAMLVDIEAQWLGDIERQGASWDTTRQLFDWYAALRGLGVDIDFVTADSDVAGYRVIVVPTLAVARAGVAARLAASGALVLFGPRSGAKTDDFTLPDGLPPGALREILPVTVRSVETLRPGCAPGVDMAGRRYAGGGWRERIDADDAERLASFADGGPALVRKGRALYLATLADADFRTDLLERLCVEAGVATRRLPPTVRLRRRGGLVFAINYGDAAISLDMAGDATFVIGDKALGPRDVAVWREDA